VKKPQNIKNDLLSGLTVALALIPEAIAFAFVAGVHPKVGLYAAFIMGVITALFGGRPGMISGATGAVAVIFAPLVYKMMQLSTSQGLSFEAAMSTSLSYLFAAVILMGIIQVIFGVLKLGKLIRLVPHPVMLGFVNGLAIIIFKAQFGQFMIKGELLDYYPLIVMGVLIALTMLISIFLPKLTKAIPATLAGIVIVSFISHLINNFEPGLVRTVLDFVKDQDASITTIKAGFPSFAIPQIPLSFEAFKLILPYAVLAAAVGLIESLMTLSLVDELTETKGHGNQESIAQGFGNIISGFFGAMGGCAMIGQSMINIRGGGQGRLSGASAALFLLAFIIFGSSLIEVIPLAALVGVMFMVVIGTFEWSSLKLPKKIPHSDLFIIILVTVVTIYADLAIAVIVGIIVSALVFSWEHGKAISAHKETSADKTLYEINGPLFFGSVSSFKELFDFKEDRKNIVLDFKNSRVWDHSGLEALHNITQRYEKYDKKLQVTNLSPESIQLLDKAKSIIDLSVLEQS